MKVWTIILQEFIIPLLTGLASAVSVYLLGLATAWITKKFSLYLSGVKIKEIQEVAEEAIIYTYQELTSRLKKDSKDGSLTKDEALSSTKMATDFMLNKLQASTIKWLQTNKKDVNAYLADTIKQTLGSLKLNGYDI